MLSPVFKQKDRVGTGSAFPLIKVNNKDKRLNAHGIQPLVKPDYVVIEVSAQSGTSKILCLLHVPDKSDEDIQNYLLKKNTHVFLLCTLLLQHRLTP